MEGRGARATYEERGGGQQYAERAPRVAGGTSAALLYLVSAVLLVAGAACYAVGAALVLAGLLLAAFTTLFVLEL